MGRVGLHLVHAGIWLAASLSGMSGALAANATAPAAAAAPAEAASTLPGGADSLSETHDDWIVSCGAQQGVTSCAFVQTQTDSRSQQRLLAVQLRPGKGKSVDGLLVLPFGLLLDNGITLQVDDQKPSDVLRYKTCIPGGCLVPVTFDADMTDALRAGSALKISAVASDSGQPVAFTVSLKGFAGAMARAAELSK